MIVSEPTKDQNAHNIHFVKPKTHYSRQCLRSKNVWLWFCSFPDSGHHSTATITLDQQDDRTQLTLTQTGIPEEDFERTKEGWKQYYWENMKQTFFWGMKYFWLEFLYDLALFYFEHVVVT